MEKVRKRLASRDDLAVCSRRGLDAAGFYGGMVFDDDKFRHWREGCVCHENTVVEWSRPAHSRVDDCENRQGFSDRTPQKLAIESAHIIRIDPEGRRRIDAVFNRQLSSPARSSIKDWMPSRARLWRLPFGK